jgi:Animal haem peroxidase
MIDNERSDSLLQAQFRAIQASIARREAQNTDQPISQVLTALMRHGGVYSLTDVEMMAARMAPILSSMHADPKTGLTAAEKMTPKQVAAFVSTVSTTATSFFQHLVTSNNGKDLSYAIPSSLMSHIALPGQGVAYVGPQPESPEIPAAFTFVGQFTDHDLTLNAVNLFEVQEGDVPNIASPLIDLDSVYGPRSTLDTVTPKKLFDSKGRFRLKKHGTYHDLERDAMGNAFISDKRNDENQLILQVHLLIMRTHNTFIASGLSLMEAYTETLFNWQSVLLTDYLTRVLDQDVYADQLVQIQQPNFGNFRYKPYLNLTDNSFVARMPHEFAIGFRMGHSQLRSKYQLQPSGQPFDLFNNALTSAGGPTVNKFADLRGSQELTQEKVIDWPFFAGGAEKSNRIDGKVVPVVDDLPESAIPDDIKYIGNLVHRNLIRSRQVGLCAGEDLAEFYGFDRSHLPISVIEPDAAARHLYHQGADFRTPLWYWVLKEAEHAGTATSSRLGKVGSHLIGEVILGGIKWARESVLNEPGWTSTITNSRDVKLLDLAEFAAP